MSIQEVFKYHTKKLDTLPLRVTVYHGIGIMAMKFADMDYLTRVEHPSAKDYSEDLEAFLAENRKRTKSVHQEVLM